MKRIMILVVFAIFIGNSYGQIDQVKFEIITPYGNMQGFLYNETPKHRDNFVKLVNEGWYEDSPFHRIIKNFMIQGGGNKDGKTDPGYTIPAEIMPSNFIHKKGALSAARMADQVNPSRSSSGSQFYIVQGKAVADNQLNGMETRINQNDNMHILGEYINRPENIEMLKMVDSLQRSRNMPALNAYGEECMKKIEADGTELANFHYSEEQKAVYRTLGGTPHLDGGYTVFGQITSGFDVIDKIAAVQTAAGDRPIQAVSMKIKILDK